jgi:hypothetical protein
MLDIQIPEVTEKENKALDDYVDLLYDAALSFGKKIELEKIFLYRLHSKIECRLIEIVENE